MFDMVAILGRGIQRLSENGPWVLTEDLEVCDERSAHLPVRVPANDKNPLCMIGGGEINLEAGRILIQQYEPKVVVCAYGGRSKYLEPDGPSESEVMSEALDKSFRNEEGEWSSMTKKPDIVIWRRDRQLPVPSNTRQEMLNIYDLALERGLKKIALVAVGVHTPRVGAYNTKHLSTYPQYRVLNPIVLESEEILLAAPGFSALKEARQARVRAMRNSDSFERSWKGKDREADGISKIVRDAYNDAVKPLVATT